MFLLMCSCCMVSSMGVVLGAACLGSFFPRRINPHKKDSDSSAGCRVPDSACCLRRNLSDTIGGCCMINHFETAIQAFWQYFADGWYFFFMIAALLYILIRRHTRRKAGLFAYATIVLLTSDLQSICGC